MFTSANTDGYTADELRDANAVLEHWENTHPNASEDERKAMMEKILYVIDNGQSPEIA